GILAAQEFSSELFGDESLSRRPMARIITPLQAMGANIASQSGGRPPLRITGAPLKAIDYEMPVASAQVKTSLLFAGLFADGETRVLEPTRTRDHGELALRAFGAQLKQDRNASSVAFFLCAAAIFPGSQLVISHVLMNPTRARLLDVLILVGVGITVNQ